jgi:rhodanese-related sulfurtransferase
MNNGGIPASALAGGFDAWRAAGFPVKEGRER